MTQDFTEDSYDPDHVADTDLENMEDNFLTLKSCFAGASSPSNPVAGMPWMDTSKKSPKIRNDDNTAWVGLMHADASQKIAIYRNDALDGWIVDTSVTDAIIAIKGGIQAYNVSGGEVAGTWTQPGHVLTVDELPSHRHGPQSGYSNFMSTTGSNVGGPGNNYGRFSFTDYVGGDQAHNHGTTYRPRAAVCTLQYMDL